MPVNLRKRQRKNCLLYLGVTVVALLCLHTHTGLAQEDEIAAGGRFQYQSHCAICHGTNGTGDGRMREELLNKPADLTQLTKNNNGQFPFWRMYRVIDGREEVKAHGPRTMPIWGVELQVVEGSELRATGRILELVYYLKSIQKK